MCVCGHHSCCMNGEGGVFRDEVPAADRPPVPSTPAGSFKEDHLFR